MKVCDRNRKALVWLAAGCLEDDKAGPLRDHLDQCPGCRAHFEELARIADKLRSANAAEEIQPSPFLHRRVNRALRHEKQSPGFRWSLAIPAIAMAVFVLMIFHTAPRKPVVSLAITPGEMAPTIMNYQAIANQSLDKLDAVLDEQSRRIEPAMKLYRAGDFALAAD
jgi:anti-sigma factor RsiW